MWESIAFYFSQGWVIALNVAYVIVAGLFAYHLYAQRWGAITGKYTAEGDVLWSSYELVQNGRYSSKMQGIVAYQYAVGGNTYFNEFKSPVNRRDELVKKYPAGSKATVFYAPKRPSYSQIDEPPKHRDLALEVFSRFFAGPLVLINLPIWAFGYRLAT